MFSGRHKLVSDPGDRVFIDREPKYFNVLLDFLRTGGKKLSPMPTDETEIDRIREGRWNDARWAWCLLHTFFALLDEI